MKIKTTENNLLYYIFLWTLLFLLGSYIGGIYRLLYIFVSFTLILNIIHFFVSINSIYYYQLFSTEHPQKGQIIEYKLTIENRIFLRPCFIEIIYNETLNLDKQSPKIKASSSKIIYSKFTLPYRGIYRVGIKQILCRDILNIFSYSLNFWPRTFYVYPKINKDIYLKSSGSGEITNSNIRSNSISTDYLDTIDKYRNNSKLSHISWKHFASYNEPYIKKFYSQEGSDTYIFLDRTTLPEKRKGPADDISIEILCSIIQKNISNNVKTKVNCWKKDLLNQKDFNEFYKDSIYLEFNKSKKDTIVEYKSNNYSMNNRLILITTFESNLFLDIELISKSSNITIFIITKNLDDNKKYLLNQTINKFNDYNEIICID